MDPNNDNRLNQLADIVKLQAIVIESLVKQAENQRTASIELCSMNVSLLGQFAKVWEFLNLLPIGNTPEQKKESDDTLGFCIARQCELEALMQKIKLTLPLLPPLPPEA